MGITVQRLFEEAIRLDPEKRAALTGLLIENLDPVPEQSVEEAWLAKVKRRMADLDSGAVRTYA